MFWFLFWSAAAAAFCLGFVVRGFWTAWREYKRWEEFERNAWQARAKNGGRS